MNNICYCNQESKSKEGREAGSCSLNLECIKRDLIVSRHLIDLIISKTSDNCFNWYSLFFSCV
jgi:hypothetical protein